jgi:hypothetical protein
LADSAPAFVSALNRVLFPTLGNPTIPACKAMMPPEGLLHNLIR